MDPGWVFGWCIMFVQCHVWRLTTEHHADAESEAGGDEERLSLTFRTREQINLIEQRAEEESAPDCTAACSTELRDQTGATVLKEFGLMTTTLGLRANFGNAPNTFTPSCTSAGLNLETVGAPPRQHHQHDMIYCAPLCYVVHRVCVGVRLLADVTDNHSDAENYDRSSTAPTTKMKKDTQRDKL